jgi:hypothetical protein
MRLKLGSILVVEKKLSYLLLIDFGHKAVVLVVRKLPNHDMIFKISIK